VVLFGVKDPSPLVDQTPVVVPPLTDPAKVAFVPLQITWSLFALTTITGVIVISLLSVAAAQLPFAAVVMVNETLPVAISAADGV